MIRKNTASLILAAVLALALLVGVMGFAVTSHSVTVQNHASGLILANDGPLPTPTASGSGASGGGNGGG